jgi:hypothetical protein
MSGPLGQAKQASRIPLRQHEDESAHLRQERPENSSHSIAKYRHRVGWRFGSGAIGEDRVEQRPFRRHSRPGRRVDRCLSASLKISTIKHRSGAACPAAFVYGTLMSLTHPNPPEKVTEQSTAALPRPFRCQFSRRSHARHRGRRRGSVRCFRSFGPLAIAGSIMSRAGLCPDNGRGQDRSW